MFQGATMFQSIMVTKFFDLSDQDKEMMPAQDYLDDLESIFWILVFLLFIYQPNGDKAPHRSEEHTSELQSLGESRMPSSA